MKPKAKQVLLLVTRITVEASWVLGLAGFFLYAVAKRPFPLFSGLVVFVGGAAVTHASRGKAWRRVALLAIHVGGMLGSLGLTCLAGEGAREPLLGLLKGGPSLSSIEEGMAWVTVLLSGFWTVFLWLKGSALARRQGTHERVCNQFDLGVACFGLIFIVAAMARIRWGVDLAWGPSVLLFALFFCASVMAMGMATPETRGAAVPRESFQGVWALTAFCLLILGAGAGIVHFLMPFLQQGTQLAFSALRETTSPLGPVLVRCLRFLLAHRRTPPEQGPSHSGGGEEAALSHGEPEGEVGLLEEVLAWGLTGLLVAVLACVLATVVTLGLRALLARSGPQAAGVSHGFSLAAWFRKWIRVIRSLSVRRFIRRLREPGPVRLYGRLASWGKHSGLPHGANETPCEYGRRLSRVFYPLSREIDRIVGLVNREVYGGVSPGQHERLEGRLAWKRLRSPRYWPMRVRHLSCMNDCMQGLGKARDRVF